MTRAKVLQLGLAILSLGGLCYWAFLLLGFKNFSAGIASEAVLILLVFFWTASYLLRVVQGKMTFMEQRRRYIKEYNEITTTDLQTRFQSLPDEEQVKLLEEIEKNRSSSL